QGGLARPRAPELAGEQRESRQRLIGERILYWPRVAGNRLRLRVRLAGIVVVKVEADVRYLEPRREERGRAQTVQHIGLEPQDGLGMGWPQFRKDVFIERIQLLRIELRAAL